MLRISLLLLLAALLSSTAIAEPADMSKDKIPHQTLTFKQEAGLDGDIVRAEGVVGPEEKRLLIKGFDVMRPVSVTVLARDISKPIQAGIHRWFWKEPDVSGNTGNSGQWVFEGRLHKEIGIKLQADRPSEYYVLIWQGEAVDPNSVVMVQPASKLEGNNTEDGDDPGFFMMAVVALLAIAVVLLAVLVLRRGGSSSAALLLAIGLMMAAAPDAVLAQDLPNPFVDEYKAPPESNAPRPGEPPNPFVDEYKPAPEDPDGLSSQKPDRAPPKLEEPGKKPDYSGASSPEEPGKKPDYSGTSSREEPGKKPDYSGTSSHEEPGYKPPTDGGDSVAGSAGRDGRGGSRGGDGSNTAAGGDGSGADSSSRSFEDRLRAAEDRVRALESRIEANARAIEELRFALEQDRNNVPDPAPGGTRPMPSGCLDGSECAACVRGQTSTLTGLLRDYERLRVIYSDTKDFSDRMIELGDAVSGFHQLEQMAWYQEKLKIGRTVQNMQNAYDSKLREFNTELEGVLREIDSCEAQGGHSGWYDQYGQLFYLTLTSHYRRTD